MDLKTYSDENVYFNSIGINEEIIDTRDDLSYWLLKLTNLFEILFINKELV